jgi:hypothetical protein
MRRDSETTAALPPWKYTPGFQLAMLIKELGIWKEIFGISASRQRSCRVQLILYRIQSYRVNAEAGREPH